MGMYRTYFTRISCSCFSLFFLCEYLIYYFVLIQCSWPVLDPRKADQTIEPKDSNQMVKVMLLADTHLLGPKHGHWFDKLRREWQMYRAFQTAMFLQKPDVVFILGDLFDEGQWCSPEEFNAYIDRFHSIFHVPAGTKLFVAVGNHDIGFHYKITPYLQKRFTDAFEAPPVRLITLEGSHFVLLNSMAMEGDGCFLCRPAEVLLSKISRRLKCTKNPSQCSKSISLSQYSRPILLQHFPLYRESDEDCNEPDEAPEDEKSQKFRERMECISRESTFSLLDMLKPRVSFGGHTHHGCHRYHTLSNTHEFTLPSFSWRNKNNPSYALAVFTPNNYEVSKCYMPQESTVIFLYFSGILMILIYAAFSYKFLCRRQRLFKERERKKQP
uniref:Metallophosphoesterase 1 homolog n=2 Tax=Lygus hesperus TaxID=30085 RepID=A0A0A9WS93_LYGHE